MTVEHNVHSKAMYSMHLFAGITRGNSAYVVMTADWSQHSSPSNFVREPENGSKNLMMSETQIKAPNAKGNSIPEIEVLKLAQVIYKSTRPEGVRSVWAFQPNTEFNLFVHITEQIMISPHSNLR